MKIAGGTFAWPGASIGVTYTEPQTMVMSLEAFAALREAMSSPPKPSVPFIPPAGLITSLDLFEAWQRHEGKSADDLAWVRENDLKGVSLTDRVIAAFPAFAEMGGGCGFYNALHVTMEDGNIDDDNVERAVVLAAEEGDAEAHALALQLREMTEDERIALYCSLSPYGEQEF